MKILQKLWHWVTTPYREKKEKEELKKRLDELKKRDPFIYK